MGREPRLSVDMKIAFQPIIDLREHGRVFAYEALVRGPNGEGAASVLNAVTADDALALDALCREKALETAVMLGLDRGLSLNVAADAICHYRYGLHTTLRVARRLGFPLGRLIFEMTEHKPVVDPSKLRRWISAAGNRGVTVALDDFGSAYAGINTLLQLRPEMVKLDVGLVREIDRDRPRQAIVKGIVDACNAFGAMVVAECVETEAEFRMLVEVGIHLMQGYYFARPGLSCLPAAAIPQTLSGISIKPSYAAPEAALTFRNAGLRLKPVQFQS